MIGVHLTLEATNDTLPSDSPEAAELRDRLRAVLKDLEKQWLSKCDEIDRSVPLKCIAFQR